MVLLGEGRTFKTRGLRRESYVIGRGLSVKGMSGCWSLSFCLSGYLTTMTWAAYALCIMRHLTTGTKAIGQVVMVSYLENCEPKLSDSSL